MELQGFSRAGGGGAGRIFSGVGAEFSRGGGGIFWEEGYARFFGGGGGEEGVNPRGIFIPPNFEND